MFFKHKEKLNADALRNTFDSQKQILIAKGYPAMLAISSEEFNASLESLWKSFSEKATGLEIEIKGSIPLLLVVGQGDLSEKIKKMGGHTGLDLGLIKKESADQANTFSMLIDVEDGTNMVAKSPKDALKRFEKEKRHALSINESIALLTHYPDILKNHYLISAGSFYNKDGRDEPLLWLLDEDHHPELHYAWFDIAHGSYGAASYAIKI